MGMYGREPLNPERGNNPEDETKVESLMIQSLRLVPWWRAREILDNLAELGKLEDEREIPEAVKAARESH